MRYLMISGLVFIALLHGFAEENPDCTTKKIVEYIRKTDTLSLRKCLHADRSCINNFLDTKGSQTMLSVAIQAGNSVMVKYLLRHGADPGKEVRGRTPLIMTVRNNDKMILKQLLEAGADVNTRDRDGYSPIYWAVYKNDPELARILVEAGANLLTPNRAGHRPVDILTDANSEYLQSYFIYMTQAQEKALNWPDYTDGPYLIWKDTNRLEALCFKTVDKRIQIKRKELKVNTRPIVHKIPDSDEAIQISGRYNRPVDSMEMPAKLLVIGDLHGEYDQLIQLLRNNKVIDDFNNWIWGDGHLLFMGDFFDRGSKVTETLWLVHRLENQASLYGGKVHVVLGNHEIMILLGDHRYLHHKYANIMDYYAFRYDEWFGLDSEIGRYIRSKPAMIKLGSNLFVHAGISPELLKARLNAKKINTLLYEFLTQPPKKPDTTMMLLLLERGPFWFRGFLKEYDMRDEVDELYIQNVLEAFQADRIIVGHSEVEGIEPRYDGKIWAVNVPFHAKSIRPMALLIKNEEFFALDSEGNQYKFSKSTFEKK